MMSTRRSVEPVLTTEFLVLQTLLLLCLLCVKASAAGASALQVGKANCTVECGHVTIPYPFGIGTGCFLDEWYEVVCQQKKNTSVPRLKKIGVDVLNISLPTYYGSGWMSVNFPISYSSPNCTDSVQVGGRGPSVLPSLSGSNFFFSQHGNVFTAIGCNHIAFMNINNSATAACLPVCIEGSRNGSGVNYCSSYGCCQSALYSDLQAFNISFQRAGAAGPSGDGCSYAFLVDLGLSESDSTDLYSLSNLEFVPVILGWGIGNDTMSRLSEYGDYGKSFNCSAAAAATYDIFPFPECYCLSRYDGNPYLGDQGCQDQCPSSCPGKCVNTDGFYRCHIVKDGSSTTEEVDGGSRAVKLAMMVIGGFVGAVFFLLSARWLGRAIRKRRKMKLKQKFFKQNGGLLLQQQLASPEGNIEKSKLFNSKELERATDNFNENRILGQGGQGTVYKGMLADGRIVAIKKSKMLHQGDVEQFINEVSILSQINHRNVVKLLGYCLETKVPLLVYEFIPNGTLHHYLHDPNEEFQTVPWDVRLRIASEVAGALCYLHSAASIPIYHRDIKTTNILLDEKYRAKIADFGTSRSVALDQTHVTTLVQGTFGYLDPEYFQSSRFTDKSDVYSFGVVLVELLTGQKPISSLRVKEGIGLATYFIISMEEDRLFNILDARVLNHGNNEEIIAVAHIARRCLNLNGRMRPTMKEVATKLEALRRPSRPSNPLDAQEIEDRFGNFEIDVIETQDLTFSSAGFEVDDGMSLASNAFPLLPINTW